MFKVIILDPTRPSRIRGREGKPAVRFYWETPALAHRNRIAARLRRDAEEAATRRNVIAYGQWAAYLLS